MTPTAFRSTHQNGLALVAVLWMVAALSIVVVGLSNGVRSETRRTSLSRQGVVQGALGTAAVNLVIQEMLSSAEPVTRLTYKNVTFQGTEIAVEILPVNGLIDINNAPEALLTKLISIQGGMELEEARNLAQRTIDIRSVKDSTGQSRGFESVEDWLKVPGIDYTLYARMRNLVSADLFGAGSGRVNALAAPPAVLAVLTGGNTGQALRIASDRDAGRTGIDTTMLNASEIDNASTRRYRISARVPASTDTQLWTTQTIDLTAIKRDGMPWRILNAERRYEVTLPERSS